MSDRDQPAGRRRREWVRRTDKAAETVITVGGLAVLATVLGICVYLVAVAAPLFGESDTDERSRVESEAAIDADRLLFSDSFVERLRLGAVLRNGDNGSLRSIRLDDGTVIDEIGLTEGPGGVGERALVTATDVTGRMLAVGSRGGVVRSGALSFETKKVSYMVLEESVSALQDAGAAIEALDESLGSLGVEGGIGALIDSDDAYGDLADLLDAGGLSLESTIVAGAALEIADFVGFNEPPEGDPSAALARVQGFVGSLRGIGVDRREARELLLDPGTREDALAMMRAMLAMRESGESVTVGVRFDSRGDLGLSFTGNSRRGLASVTVNSDAWRVSALRAEIARDVLLQGDVAKLGVAIGTTGERLLVATDAEGRGVWRSVTSPEEGSTLVGAREQVETRDIDLGVFDGWVYPVAQERSVVVVERRGVLRRFGVPADSEQDAALVELSALDMGSEITASALASGSRTILLGFADGTTRAAWIAADPVAKPDGFRLFARDTYGAVGEGAIVSIGASPSDRTFAVLDAAGNVQIVHSTSGKRSGAFASGVALARSVEFTPKIDGVAVVGGSGEIGLWARDAAHEDASWRSLFGEVVYEGATEGETTYQSRSDDKKLSLIPLIWGTLKATFVALIIAAPIAVLAAIYSSEFLSAKPRKVIKPGIELMASLPSVVLGFVAVAIVAPFVEKHLAGVLVAAVSAPVGALAAASVWEALPDHFIRRVKSVAQLCLAVLAVGIGVGIAFAAGSLVERVAFAPSNVDKLVLAERLEPVEESDVPAWIGTRDALDADEQRRLWRESDMVFLRGGTYRLSEDPGDPGSWREEVDAELVRGGLDTPSVRRWLDTTIGIDRAWPGWAMLLAAPSLVLAVILRRLASRAIGVKIGGGLGARVAVSLGKFLIVVVLAWVLSVALGMTLEALGLDARDIVLGRFDKLNTLVVGFIMGFAIIPLIYTISEDALRSVPDSLRAASLGSGATPWQTAVRVVLPVAASGIFSACMIGLGRGVGETMIVLMATGNTPEISANIFSGFRTLAANIATELPEAEVGSTHYRVLFLCGLTLFVMTLVVNTTAELVRQRYRKRAAGM